MKRYKVNYLPSFYEDLQTITRNLTRMYKDPHNAFRATDGIITRCDTLAFFPKASVSRLNVNDKELRFVRSKKYTAVYYVDDSDLTVNVFRILHSHMDIFGILKSTE